MLTGLLAAGSASAQTSDITTPTANDDGSHTLWTATLTVEEINTSEFGYYRLTSKGTLSSDAFTIGDTSYPVAKLSDVRNSDPPGLEFFQQTTGFPAEFSNWVLYLDGTAFRVSDASGHSFAITWPNPNLNWADDDSVAVKLVRLNKPSATRNLTARSVANTQINLSWSAPSKTGGSDITGYKIEVSTDSGDNWTVLEATTSSSDTTYSHKGLTSGNTRHYRVSAINDIGTGPVSNKASATAMSPASDITTPTANDDGSHTLWTATLTVEEINTSEFGYYRLTSKGTLSSDAFTIGDTSYPVATLSDVRNSDPPGLEFFQQTTGFPAEFSNWVLYLDGTAFRVSDASGHSFAITWPNPNLNWADDDSVAVKLVRLNKPSATRNLTAKGHSNTQIDLSWRTPEKTGGDISGYKIEVSTDSSTWADLVADTESMATTYSHKGLSSGNKRYYRVSAINAAGTGGVSNVASATAVATAPGLRIALVERTNSMVVRLEFDEVVDTTSVPDKSAFTVKVKGKGEPIGLTSFTITDAGRLGWIGLASRLRPGQEVTLSYTKPGSNMLKDAAADETPSFADYPVINELSNDFPILSVRDEEVRESGDSTTRAMTFTVRVDTEPDFAVGVYYETEDVSATGGKACSGSSPPDYISTEGRLRLGPGETSKEVVVTVCDDNVEDGGETFRLDLFSTQLHEPIDSIGQVPKSYIGEITASATGTILNSETTTEVSVVADEVYAEEGTEVVFTLRRAGDAEEALTVPVSVAEDGAVLGTPVPASVTFAAGSRQAALRVPTDDDDSDEADSRVTATVKAGFAWQVAEDAASAAVMVLDNDAPPVEGGTATEVTIWSADMTVVEYGPRSIGAGSADLFSNQRGRPGMRARWLWYDPSARELRLAFDDGVDDADSLTLHVGEVSMGFPENTGGNSSFTFEDVDVSWTAGDTLAARISKPSTETVSTDATLASLAVEGATLSPAFDAGVLVYRAAVEAGVETVTVTASANDGGAAVAYGPAEDADAELADHQVATPEGETLVEVAVTAADGRTARRYRVVLARAADTVTVAGSGQLSVADAEATEEDDTAVEFVVTLAPASSDTVTVDYATSDGTATAGSDYTATSGTLTFAAGDTAKTVSVPIADDTEDDGGETFTLTLSNASGAGLGDAEATGTIRNAEAAAELSVADAEASEEDDTAVEFVVTLAPASSDTVTVDYATSDGTAAAGSDYTATSGTLTFAAGDTAKTVSVPIADDTEDDGGETFTLTLSNASGAGLGDAEATGTIRNAEAAAELSVADAEASEEDDTAVEFVVTLAPASSDTVTVDYATSDGTAAAGSDYTATSGTLTFAAGDTAKTVSVPIADDTEDDGGETFTLTLSNASGAGLGDAEATGTIRNAEAAAELSVADAEASEEDDTAVEFVVTLAPASSDTVTVDYATSDGTAAAGSDYTATSGTLTFAAGDTAKTVSVPIADDTEDDGGETFTLTLSNASGAGLGDAEATGTIRNAEAAAELSVADAEASEEDDTAVEFVVTLAPASSDTVTVDYATSDGTAAAGSDYTATSGTLTFAAGDTAKTVSVPIADDTEDDGGETFTLTLSNASGAGLGDAEATGTIRNAETPPLTASFSNMPASHTAEDFTFGLAFSEEVELSYVTLRDTAFAVTGGEVKTAQRQQQGSDQTWNITVDPDGQGAVTITLPETTDCDAVDAICTGDERPLSHSLSSVVAGPVIIPAVSVSDASAGEGDAVAFMVSLSPASSQQVTVDYATSDGTAAAGSDYTAQSGTLTFAANETSKTVSIATTDDSVDEENETFTLTLSSPTNATLGDATATGTINDNDESLPSVSVSGASASEGEAVAFTVSLSPASSQQVAVDYATSDGTAAAGSDYTAQSGTLTFAANETSKTVSIATTDDSVDEENETFTLTLSSPTNATLGDATATGTINDNDESLPSVSVSGASASEGEAVAFTVSLSPASSQQVAVDYATSDGTAAAGSDYTAQSGTLTFAANETSKTVSIATTDDSVDEENETFTLTLSSPTNATLGDATATGTINDNDESLPSVSVSGASASEGEAVAFTVSLSPASSQQVAVDYATSDGTAAAGSDYTAQSGTLTFAANETSKTVSIATTDDSVDEENETFTLTLSSPTNATLGDATATGTINDDDVSTTPLTASFSNMPASHTGEDFTFGLAFSEEVELSYVTLRDTAFVVTGGEVKTAQRQQQGSNQAWNITVKPTSASDTVTITLPETTDCRAVDAICTKDERPRPLSHSLSATVVDAASSTAGDAANGVVADDLLALLDGLTTDEATEALFGERRLSEARLDALDRLGNRNGRYDLGDLLSWIERCRRGEARCGTNPTDSGPASSAALFGAAAAGRRRISKRPMRGMRRRARMAGYALAMLFAATMAGSCTDDFVGPPDAEPGPGFLTVEWTGPAAARDIGVLIELEGPGIETVRAPGLDLYESSEPGRHQVVVAGSLRAGPLVQFRVPDRGQLPLYRVRVVQVTSEDYALRDPGEYRAVITLN